MSNNALDKIEPTLNQIYKSLQPDTPFGAWVEGLRQQGKLEKIEGFLSKIRGSGDKIDSNDIEFQELILSLEQDDEEKILGLPPWLAITLGITVVVGGGYLAIRLLRSKK